MRYVSEGSHRFINQTTVAAAHAARILPKHERDRYVLAHRHQTLSLHRCWSGHAQLFRDQRHGSTNSQQSRGSVVRTPAAAAAATDLVTLLPRLEYQPDASHPSGQPSSAAFGEPLAGSSVPLGATLLPEQVLAAVMIRRTLTCCQLYMSHENWLWRPVHRTGAESVTAALIGARPKLVGCRRRV
jgi:hypothetical protein